MRNKYVGFYVFNKLKQFRLLKRTWLFYTRPASWNQCRRSTKTMKIMREEVRDQLYELKFTEEELEAHMSLGQTLKSLLNWRDLFDEYLLNELYESNTKIDDEVNSEYHVDRHKPTTPTDGRVILNKRNPFADVSIKPNPFYILVPKGF